MFRVSVQRSIIIALKGYYLFAVALRLSHSFYWLCVDTLNNVIYKHLQQLLRIEEQCYRYGFTQ